MNTVQRSHRIAWFLVAGLMLSATAPVLASGAGQIAAAQVSEASYRHYLDDMLYTHAGDNRGFGPEHDLAQANIAALFASFGLTVTLEPVNYGGDIYYNVVGTKLGATLPDQEYIIGSHYDSVNNPGADDNASGTALVLETARVLTQYPSESTIRFIAFDREEQGLHGSEQYVLAHINDDIQGMISADMVAYNTGANHVDIYGRSASNPIKTALAAAVDTYGEWLTRSIGGSLDGSDHAPFEWYGFQACLIIEDWGNPYYHTQQDNVDTPNYIDYPYATQITRVVVGYLVDNAGVMVDTPDGDFDDDGDVDMDDYLQFDLCFTGPDGGPLIPECIAGDFDVDGDIDCDDWQQFVLAWTEPGDPPQLPDCILVNPLPASSAGSVSLTIPVARTTRATRYPTIRRAGGSPRPESWTIRSTAMPGPPFFKSGTAKSSPWRPTRSGPRETESTSPIPWRSPRSRRRLSRRRSGGRMWSA
jgi:hypothetical protein